MVYISVCISTKLNVLNEDIDQQLFREWERFKIMPQSDDRLFAQRISFQKGVFFILIEKRLLV